MPYKPCVQCQVFKTGELTPEECLDNCTQFNSTIVDVVGECLQGSWLGGVSCRCWGSSVREREREGEVCLGVCVSLHISNIL